MKHYLTKKITRQKLEEFLRKYASSDKFVLDLGCGSAKHGKYFPNRVGFDIAPAEGVDVVGDAHNLPFAGNHFDMVVCTEVLEHLHTPHLAIAEMRRVLKPGGILILSTRFIFPLHDAPNDFYRYTKYGLRHLFRDGWDILELTEEAGTIETLAVLLQRIGFQTRLLGGRISKFFVFLAARMIPATSFLIREEFGGIKRDRPERSILTSGYYLVCRKK